MTHSVCAVAMYVFVCARMSAMVHDMHCSK